MAKNSHRAKLRVPNDGATEVLTDNTIMVDTRVLNPNSEGSEAGVESARFPDQSSLVNGHIPSQPPMADLQQPTIPYENMAESPPLSRASEASSRREARAAELAEYHDPASSSHAAPPQQTSYSQRAQELAAKCSSNDGMMTSLSMQHRVLLKMMSKVTFSSTGMKNPLQTFRQAPRKQ
eukprot:g4330.t1